LINAKIKNVMITGDALLTALHVAYNCNIISSNKNVYVGELDSQNQINWTFYESKEMRDK
jgi:magnesium-transporting ATPase (P-type)